jgi:hypothetical protein
MTADELAAVVAGIAPIVRKYVADQLAASATALEARVATCEMSLGVRVAALEAAPAPRDGRDGRDGTDGATGAAGLDGLGFGDLELVHDGERRITVRAVAGDRVKDLGTVAFPCEIYRDVWAPRHTYERGDCVTWAGSEWHANAATTAKPGDGSPTWTLKVKRGRDGKDAPAAAFAGAR